MENQWIETNIVYFNSETAIETETVSRMRKKAEAEAKDNCTF